jgi:hypothetical protein
MFKEISMQQPFEKQEANGEGTITFSQMSSTFQLPLKKSGHHFCFSSFIKLLLYTSNKLLYMIFYSKNSLWDDIFSPLKQTMTHWSMYVSNF